MNIALEPATLAERIDALDKRVRELEAELANATNPDNIIIYRPRGCDCGCEEAITLTRLLAKLERNNA